MKSFQSICVPLLIAAVGCSLVVGAMSYWLTNGMTIAVYVMVACLGSAVATGLLIARSQQEAITRLRNPELRVGSLHGTGIYRGVLEEVFNLVQRSEAQARAASKSKAEIEARWQVRRRETRRWDRTLQTIETPVLITDARGKLTYYNEAASSVFQAVAGHSGDSETDKTPDLARIPPLEQLITETLTRNAATDRRTTEIDLEIDGQPQAYRATAKIIYDESESVLGLATILADIQDERLANTRHAEFVSSVSHELKTPMASIKAFLELLLDGDVDDPEEQKELFGFMDVQVDRLTRLVNNMLNLARIESGVIDIKRVDTELNDALSNALTVVEPVAEEKQIRVVSDLSDMYLAAHIDKDLFGQAIINLLSNAAKYTPEGGEIRLRSRMVEGQAVIEVRDTGMGIPEESLPHIFDRFYRVPENNKAAAGTGLGLALVHYVITDVHNAKIEVESTINQGTCFRITLPLGHRDHARKKREDVLATV